MHIISKLNKIYQTFKMGCSVGYLIQRWGPQIATILGLEKAEELLNSKSKQAKDIVQNSSKEIKASFKTTFSEQKKKVDDIFKDTKQSVGQQKLEAFASAQGKSVDEALGETEVNQKFNEIEKTFNQEFKKQVKTLQRQIQTQVKQIKKTINSQKPMVPCFSQLSDDQRTQVVKAIEGTLGGQMEQKEKKYTDTIQNALNPEKFKQMLDGLNPADKLEELGSGAESAAKAVKLAAGGLGGLPF